MRTNELRTNVNVFKKKDRQEVTYARFHQRSIINFNLGLT